MTKPIRWVTATVVAIAALALWLRVKPSGERLAVDLLERFPAAEIKRPNAEVFTLVDATLQGATRRAIQVDGPSRLGWKVTVPERAWLEFAIGQREESWTTPGDGTLFLVGVSDGQTFEELMSLVVNPYANPGDRTWHRLQLDLGVFAGRTVEIIFNTFSSPPDQPVDARGDLPVWGEPRIVVR